MMISGVCHLSFKISVQWQFKYPKTDCFLSQQEERSAERSKTRLLKQFVSFVLLSLDDEAPKIVWSGDVVSIRKMSVPLCSEEHKWSDKDSRRQSEKQPFLIVILFLCN